MAGVFVFTQGRHSRANGMVRRDPLQCLNSGLLVDANRVNAVPLVGFDRLVIGLANRCDALVVERIGFVFACQPILVLVGPDLRTPQKLVNPSSTDRLKDLLRHQVQTEFASAPSGDRSFVFFGSSQAVLKMAACCSAVMRGGRPLRLRSDNSAYHLGFQNMSLFAAFDIDQSLPVVAPPSTPSANGVMLQTNQRLDLLRCCGRQTQGE